MKPVNGLERAIDGGARARHAAPGERGDRGARSDILFVAGSLERIGDHVVYAAMGEDVRHASVNELERLLQG